MSRACELVEEGGEGMGRTGAGQSSVYTLLHYASFLELSKPALPGRIIMMGVTVYLGASKLQPARLHVVLHNLRAARRAPPRGAWTSPERRAQRSGAPSRAWRVAWRRASRLQTADGFNYASLSET